MIASELIDKRIEDLNDWRGETLARLRKIIRDAVPDLQEEWKWDTPVWAHNGDVVAVGAFQNHVKLNFFHGALLADHHLFNAGLEAAKSRGIDLREGDSIDEAALKELIRAAAALNDLKPKPAKRTAKAAANPRSKPSSKATSDLPKISAPAQRALAGAGIQNLKQLSKFSETEIEALHGIGPNALKELKKALKKNGLAFRNKRRM